MARSINEPACKFAPPANAIGQKLQAGGARWRSGQRRL